ncbi:MAG TPA: NAD(P)H-dependent oxidoreductase [Gryllotalpicola sp.]
MNTAVVVGNPKPQSRTLEAAQLLLRRIAGHEPDTVVDVIELGSGLLGWGDAGIKASVASVAESSLVVFASPTFKATYTGLLKLFLDQFPTGDGLAGVTAVPLMLGAGPVHALAPELLLKPVLVELGATVPVQGLYLNEKSYLDETSTQPWLDRWRGVLLASAGLREQAG